MRGYWEIGNVDGLPAFYCVQHGHWFTFILGVECEPKEIKLTLPGPVNSGGWVFVDNAEGYPGKSGGAFARVRGVDCHFPSPLSSRSAVYCVLNYFATSHYGTKHGGDTLFTFSDSPAHLDHPTEASRAFRALFGVRAAEPSPTERGNRDSIIGSYSRGVMHTAYNRYIEESNRRNMEAALYQRRLEQQEAEARAERLREQQRREAIEDEARQARIWADAEEDAAQSWTKAQIAELRAKTLAAEREAEAAERVYRTRLAVLSEAERAATREREEFEKLFGIASEFARNGRKK